MPAAGAAALAEPKTAVAATKTIVAITACPTGIAHTYMAADALKLAAERAGVDFVVETQGSSGSTPLAASTISGADAVIFATDVGVKDRGRFAGKPVIASGVKRAINEPDKMIAEAVAASDNPNAAKVEGSAAAAAESSGGGDVGWGTRIRQILLTGVSYMIPFVAAGGLLIALGFLFAGYDIANKPEGATQSLGNIIATTNSLTNLPSGGFFQYLGAVLFSIGGLAFGFLVPALAGYISFAIADRPGIAPGFTAGAVAVFVGGGFIGGIVGGLIAGFTALWIGHFNVPRWLRGLMPVVIIPLGASLVVGLLMFMLLGRPLAAITTGLTNWLSGMTGSSVILLGIILGLMMCFDLGGPVNKAAYAFAVAGLNIAEPSIAAHHGGRDGRGHGAAAGDGARLHGPARPVHRAGAGERQGRLASRCLVHLRGSHPVRRGRPAAGDPVDDGGRRGDRRDDHGVQRARSRPRTAVSSSSSRSVTCCGSWSRWSPAPSSPPCAWSPPNSSPASPTPSWSRPPWPPRNLPIKDRRNVRLGGKVREG